jgi:hypothetical protein
MVKYGYPLIQYSASLDAIIDSLGTNALYHEEATADADKAAIIRPNVDTVYSRVAIDLSSANVVVTVPTIPTDRFYEFSFYDL